MSPPSALLYRCLHPDCRFRPDPLLPVIPLDITAHAARASRSLPHGIQPSAARSNSDRRATSASRRLSCRFFKFLHRAGCYRPRCRCLACLRSRILLSAFTPPRRTVAVAARLTRHLRCMPSRVSVATHLSPFRLSRARPACRHLFSRGRRHEADISATSPPTPCRRASRSEHPPLTQRGLAVLSFPTCRLFCRGHRRKADMSAPTPCHPTSASALLAHDGPAVPSHPRI